MWWQQSDIPLWKLCHPDLFWHQDRFVSPTFASCLTSSLVKFKDSNEHTQNRFDRHWSGLFGCVRLTSGIQPSQWGRSASYPSPGHHGWLGRTGFTGTPGYTLMDFVPSLLETSLVLLVSFHMSHTLKACLKNTWNTTKFPRSISCFVRYPLGSFMQWYQLFYIS